VREILFRGKRLDNGEWVYGLLCRVGDTYANIVEKSTEVMCAVLTNTIGQSTGLTDKNGRKIFEGDIIHLEYSQVFFGGVYFGEYTAEVSYKEGCFITDGTNNGDEIETPLSGFDNDEVEIIGNIHDNPELLGGESDG
jgi:uncharacterized phage protein (TIGR01671 family)